MNEVATYLRDEDLNFEALALLDDTSGDSLQIQRALEFDKQDAELGMGTYCVVRGGLVHYGGVVGWDLSDEAFTLRLDREAASELQLPQEFVLAVPVGAATLIRAHLDRLLGATLGKQR